MWGKHRCRITKEIAIHLTRIITCAKLGLVTMPSEMQKNGEMQEGDEVRLLQIYHYEPTLLHLTEKITTFHVKILLFTREYTK